MKIYDTLHNSKSKIPENVRIYLCGVTVYDESHIGHARTIIVFDVLRRYLEHVGANVKLVQNFTDVDDKIINRAKLECVSPKNISERYINEYYESFDKLNVKRATIYPKATEHIEDIIKFIEKLINNKIAYVTKNGVYFAVSKFPKYGMLSKKNIEQLRSGARIEIDETKKDPLDFALWKSDETEYGWESPWGKGRPGWHIECSAMSAKYLGGNFEIHGGGRDLIFPHHENEIAQSEACTKIPLAKTWMYVGMVTINSEKMSKSLGNVRTVRTILDSWGPNIIRLFCLSGHYSKPIDYTESILGEYLTKWRQAETCFYELIHVNSQYHNGVQKMIEQLTVEFNSALENDLNTHTALSSFFTLIKKANKMIEEESIGVKDAKIIKDELERMMQILGLQIQKVTNQQKDEIDILVAKRNKLRHEGEFKEADEIRSKLNESDIEIIDHKDRTIWIKKEKIKADK